MLQRVGAVSLLAFVLTVSGCTATRDQAKVVPAVSSLATEALSLAGKPDQICRAQFPTTTLAFATTYGSALHGGTSGPDVTGVGAYPSDEPAVECLVEDKSRAAYYARQVIILSDATVIRVGTQSQGKTFEPRP